MGIEANIVNTIGIILEIAGVAILLTGATKLRWVEGGFDGPHYIEEKSKMPPKALALPNDMRTKISVTIAIIGLIFQIVATWMTN